MQASETDDSTVDENTQLLGSFSNMSNEHEPQLSSGLGHSQASQSNDPVIYKA